MFVADKPGGPGFFVGPCLRTATFLPLAPGRHGVFDHPQVDLEHVVQPCSHVRPVLRVVHIELPACVEPARGVYPTRCPDSGLGAPRRFRPAWSENLPGTDPIAQPPSLAVLPVFPGATLPLPSPTLPVKCLCLPLRWRPGRGFFPIRKECRPRGTVPHRASRNLSGTGWRRSTYLPPELQAAPYIAPWASRPSATDSGVLSRSE